jgi:putative peptidoglycan lipid II flippase
LTSALEHKDSAPEVPEQRREAVYDGDSLVGDSMAGSIWTGVSRITGFVRAAAIAAVLGATYLGNTFQALNSLPNLVYYQLLAGSLFASVLVPVLVRHLKESDEHRAQEVLGAFYGRMLAIAAAACILLLIGGWAVLQIMAAGVADNRVAAAQRHVGLIMLVVFVPQVALYVVAGVGAAAMNAKRRFALAAGAPAVENVIIILFVVITFVMFGNESDITKVSDSEAFVLALGASIAVFCHALLSWWGARRAGMQLSPRRARHDADVRIITRRMVPALAYSGLAFLQVLTLVVASNREAGGVVALQLALNFYSLPLALVAWPVARALLPQLAGRSAEQQQGLFAADLRRALALATFIVIPITVAYLTLSVPLARGIAFGNLDGSSVDLVAWSLAALAPGILAETFLILGTYACYAREDMRTPLGPKALSVGVTIVGVIAVLPVQGQKVVPLLALALSVGTIIGALRMWYVLRRQIPLDLDTSSDATSTGPSFTSTIMRSLGVSLVMVVPALLVVRMVEHVSNGKLSDILALAAAGLVCIVIFVAGQMLLRSPEIAWIKSSVFSRPAPMPETVPT